MKVDGRVEVEAPVIDPRAASGIQGAVAATAAGRYARSAETPPPPPEGDRVSFSAAAQALAQGSPLRQANAAASAERLAELKQQVQADALPMNFQQLAARIGAATQEP